MSKLVGMDWIGLTALVIAVAALVATIWQIARTEGMRTSPQWRIIITDDEMSTEPMYCMTIEAVPATDFTHSHSELAVWGQVRIVEHPGLSVERKPTKGRVVWDTTDKNAKVGVTWIAPSYFRRRPVQNAVRVDLQSLPPKQRRRAGYDTPPAERHEYVWRWAWIQPPLKRIARRGHWKLQPATLRSVLPPKEVPNPVSRPMHVELRNPRQNTSGQ